MGSGVEKDRRDAWCRPWRRRVGSLAHCIEQGKGKERERGKKKKKKKGPAVPPWVLLFGVDGVRRRDGCNYRYFWLSHPPISISLDTLFPSLSLASRSPPPPSFASPVKSVSLSSSPVPLVPLVCFVVASLSLRIVLLHARLCPLVVLVRFHTRVSARSDKSYPTEHTSAHSTGAAGRLPGRRSEGVVVAQSSKRSHSLRQDSFHLRGLSHVVAGASVLFPHPVRSPQPLTTSVARFSVLRTVFVRAEADPCVLAGKCCAYFQPSITAFGNSHSPGRTHSTTKRRGVQYGLPGPGCPPDNRPTGDSTHKSYHQTAIPGFALLLVPILVRLPRWPRPSNAIKWAT